ncbi:MULTISPECIES: hypothetical protein [Enterococcus]|uniref:hypothetical protein n=1 Tax=Enterococcus TaxID=1350 RepID=UPI001788DBF9|nr:hypothetical protein [Enterococcus avium]HBI1562881.1 hypothetical protein [Enterococcus faecalis]HBI1566001.1 hypothetical protein [Enterococcus faecalis]HBI1718430.1 hypothetical protein [Enterococcus faecalis]HBI1721412.1 hypothetical protein [Enterococcus faecalis]HBI1724394.1 hypothetical protein [Enterococcus faecalis]
MVTEKDIGLYVMLAMKNLYFTNIQIENIASKVQRLLKSMSTEEVKLKLAKKKVKNKY